MDEYQRQAAQPKNLTLNLLLTKFEQILKLYLFDSSTILPEGKQNHGLHLVWMVQESHVHENLCILHSLATGKDKESRIKERKIAFFQ